MRLAPHKRQVDVVKADGDSSKPTSPSTRSIPSGPQSSQVGRSHKIVALRALWIVILLIHVACASYYAFVALLYHTIPTTLLGAHMTANNLIISMRHVPVIVGVFGIFSILHGVFLLEMLIRSAGRRSIFFHSSAFKLTRALSKVKGLQIRPSTSMRTGELNAVSSIVLSSVLTVTKRTASKSWASTFGATGLFGVGGKHFAIVFLVREVIETILQSAQAHSLSKHVPRVWLNRSAVAIVVAGCWSSPVVHKLLHKTPRLRLLACLLIDTLLDVASSIGTSVALGAMYFPDYNSTRRTFPDSDWGNDAWVANLNTEFKQLFVQSWYDLFTRTLFAVTLLMSLDDVKLLAAATARDFARGSVTKSAVGSWAVKARERFEKLVYAGLISWGFVILGLHFASAGDSGDLTDCMVHVHPWLTTKTACVAMEINCTQHAGMVGTSAELEARWAPLDAPALKMLIFRNCPKLRMPMSIQSFPNLAGLYIYFSTVLEWSASAALSRTHHPNLRQISLVFANMTAACDPSSSLPPGLLDRDFPQTLGTVIIAGVPLTKLPSDLHEIWPPGIYMRLMLVGFNDIPDVLLRMDPVRLNVQYNNITRLPASIFEVPTLKWLDVGATPLRELPEHAEPSPSLLLVSMVGTSVASLPEWMTRQSFLNRVQVVASKSPVCTQLRSQQDADSKALAKRVCL